MPLHPCTGCGTPTAGRRCTRCGGTGRPVDRTAYDDPTYRLARAELHLSDPATMCWICGEPGTASDPLTADHLASLAEGGAVAGPLKPAHRSCNGRRGAVHTPPARGIMQSRVKP